MTITIVRGTEVTRPTTTPLSSSLLDHATVVNHPHFALVNEAGLWPSYNCLEMATPTPMCPDPLLTETGDVKVFSSAEWQPAFSFAVYGGVQCSHVGLDAADQKREVGRVFRLNEGKAIEQALLSTRFVAADSDSPGQWDAPEDITPGSPIDMKTALALLEGYSGALYAGVPTLHMPRAAATLLSANGLITWQGNKAFTKNGSKVAIGGGYDDTTMLATGDWDMYASGEVLVERSGDVEVHQYPVLPGDGLSDTGSDDPNQFGDNSMLALAEQVYRVAIDCFVIKVTGSISASGGFGA